MMVSEKRALCVRVLVAMGFAFSLWCFPGVVLAQWAFNGNEIYNTNSGNVGIGTAWPERKLHLSASFPVIRIQDSDNGAGVGAHAYIEFGQTEGNAWSRTGYVGDGFGGERALGIDTDGYPIKFSTDNFQTMRLQIATDGSLRLAGPQVSLKFREAGTGWNEPQFGIQPVSANSGVGFQASPTGGGQVCSPNPCPPGFFQARYNDSLIDTGGIQIEAGYGTEPHRIDTWRIGAGLLKDIQFSKRIVADGAYTPLVHIKADTGNVGIGTTTPDGRLHVVGDLIVTGLKNFQIAHPIEPERKWLVHSALEGPEAAVYYRGEAQLHNGKVVIALPSYFEALARKEQRTVQLTPIDGWSPLYVEEKVQEGRFTVRTAKGGDPDQRFYWEVKAVRADVPSLVVEKPKGSETQ
ncbi:MAG: hypothetical protein HY914_14240 [Desulfomonile tiedjei]|nr:hypothetical protein [Desulfomonile tiedjei]